jgi:hypothetical protein
MAGANSEIGIFDVTDIWSYGYCELWVFFLSYGYSEQRICRAQDILSHDCDVLLYLLMLDGRGQFLVNFEILRAITTKRFNLEYNLRGSARHFYVVCIYGAICLQIQKIFFQILLVFHQTVKYQFYSMLCPNLCKNFQDLMVKQEDIMI